MKLRVTALFALSSVAALADPPPAETQILDRAERVCAAEPCGSPALAEYWDGYEPGTELEIAAESKGKEASKEWTTGFRVTKREGRKVFLKLSSNGTETEVALEGLPPGPGPADPLVEKPVDRVETDRETVKIGDKEFACTVYERTVSSTPECGNDPVRSHVRRTRAWRCADVAEQGGLLRVRVTEEDDFGSGLKVTATTELAVTALHVMKKVGEAELEGYAVELKSARTGAAETEAKQVRMDTIPGGVIESTETLRAPWADLDIVTTHSSIRNLCIVRKATLEKDK